MFLKRFAAALSIATVAMVMLAQSAFATTLLTISFFDPQDQQIHTNIEDMDAPQADGTFAVMTSSKTNQPPGFFRRETGPGGERTFGPWELVSGNTLTLDDGRVAHDCIAMMTPMHGKVNTGVIDPPAKELAAHPLPPCVFASASPPPGAAQGQPIASNICGQGNDCAVIDTNRGGTFRFSAGQSVVGYAICLGEGASLGPGYVCQNGQYKDHLVFLQFPNVGGWLVDGHYVSKPGFGLPNDQTAGHSQF